MRVSKKWDLWLNSDKQTHFPENCDNPVMPSGACTSFHAPREHWSIGALLIFFCSRIVLQKMYEVLLQRSTGSKEHLTRLSLCSLLSCLSLPLIGPRRPVRASDWMLLAPCSSGVQDVRATRNRNWTPMQKNSIIAPMLLCSNAPLEHEKMYKPQSRSSRYNPWAPFKAECLD